MGIVEKIRAKNERAQSLAGFRLAFCLHITKETSVLAMAAKRAWVQTSQFVSKSHVGYRITLGFSDNIEHERVRLAWRDRMRISAVHPQCPCI